MMLPNLLTTAIKASELAAEKILEVYHTDFSSTVQEKSDLSPLTLADIEANTIIVKTLLGTYPDIPILSEEGGTDVPLNAMRCWVVDPLDGTKEFVKKNGEFTVNIALVENGKPVIGVVAIPASGAVYYAVKGYGAFKRIEKINFDNLFQAKRLSVTSKISDLVWVGSRTHSGEQESKLIENKKHLIKETVSVGSSLKGIMIAEGKADVYYRFGLTNEWDVCAMHCIVEEAGGILRQMDGSEMCYNRANHLNEKGFFTVNCEENIWIL